MAIRERNKLKGWFQTGAYPTQDQFWDWMDSFLHKSEDTVTIDNIAGLRALLDNKAEFEAFNTLYRQVNEMMAASPKKIWRTDVEFPLTDEYLNTEYPDATVGTQVICPAITQGGELYEKYDATANAWFRLYMTKPAEGGTEPGTGNPGVMAGIEIDNYM